MQYQCGSPAVLKLCHITGSLALEAPRPALCSLHSTFSLFKHKVLWHAALHQLPLLPFTTTCIYIWAHSAVYSHFSSTIREKYITSRNWLVFEQPPKVCLQQWRRSWQTWAPSVLGPDCTLRFPRLTLNVIKASWPRGQSESGPWKQTINLAWRCNGMISRQGRIHCSTGINCGRSCVTGRWPRSIH